MISRALVRLRNSSRRKFSLGLSLNASASSFVQPLGLNQGKGYLPVQQGIVCRKYPVSQVARAGWTCIPSPGNAVVAGSAVGGGWLVTVGATRPPQAVISIARIKQATIKTVSLATLDPIDVRQSLSRFGRPEGFNINSAGVLSKGC